MHIVKRYALGMAAHDETLRLPEGSYILCVKMFRGEACLYALQPANARGLDTYKVLVIGDDAILEDENVDYIGSVEIRTGLMFHVFTAFMDRAQTTLGVD